MREQPSFDPLKYKEAIREQWQNAAEAWHRWVPVVRAWAGPATIRMFELARVGVGALVESGAKPLAQRVETKETEAAARALGVRLQPMVEVRDPGELDAAFVRIARDGARGVFVVGGSIDRDPPVLILPTEPAEHVRAAWSLGHARTDLGVPLTYPTHCPVCHALIYFHTNGNGDVVFFDRLGKPWPKHPCLTSEASRKRSIATSPQTWRHVWRIASLNRRPTKLSPPGADIIVIRGALPEASRLVGRSVNGVVCEVGEARTEYARSRDSGGSRPFRVQLVDLFVKPNLVVVVAVPASLECSVGDMLKATLELAQFEYRAVLYAADAEVIAPPDLRSGEA